MTLEQRNNKKDELQKELKIKKHVKLSEDEKYLVISISDARLILEELHLSRNPALTNIISRLKQDTGANILDIATQLKKMEVCAACSIEGQERSCYSLLARKLGRRLYRLLLRANYINTEGF